MGNIVLISNLASSHPTSAHKQNETVKGHNQPVCGVLTKSTLACCDGTVSN